MNRFVAAALCGSLAFCGAQAFANANSTGSNAPADSSTLALKQKLMRECMSHESKSYVGAKDACRSQVASQLTDIKTAGKGPGQQKPG